LPPPQFILINEKRYFIVLGINIQCMKHQTRNTGTEKHTADGWRTLDVLDALDALYAVFGAARSTHHPKQHPDLLNHFATILFPDRQTDRLTDTLTDGIGDR